jgi:hypothetical protein
MPVPASVPFVQVKLTELDVMVPLVNDEAVVGDATSIADEVTYVNNSIINPII